MSEKIYTVAEANELLPYLAPALVELREKYEAAARAHVEVAQASSGNGHDPVGERETATMARVNELIERIASWKIELRDLRSGLVDFPGIVEGEQAWLCWRLGEEEVAYWHRKDEGFSSRQRLPGTAPS